MAFNNMQTGQHQQNYTNFQNSQENYFQSSDSKCKQSVVVTSSVTENVNYWLNNPKSKSPFRDSSCYHQFYECYIPHKNSAMFEAQNIYEVGDTHHNNNITNINNNYRTTNTVPFVRVAKRRTTANKKERRRTQSINNAYADLRDCIPNVPPDTKLSKIKTLRLATSYINYLVKTLEGDDPSVVGISFTAELGTINCEKSNQKTHHHHQRNHNECLIMGQNNCNNNNVTAIISGDINSMVENGMKSRKIKGRTGWPQHMWAYELEQEQQQL